MLKFLFLVYNPFKKNRQMEEEKNRIKLNVYRIWKQLLFGANRNYETQQCNERWVLLFHRNKYIKNTINKFCETFSICLCLFYYNLCILYWYSVHCIRTIQIIFFKKKKRCTWTKPFWYFELAVRCQLKNIFLFCNFPFLTYICKCKMHQF